MKQNKLFILIASIAFVFSGCSRWFCEPDYLTFTENELKLLWDNVDAEMSFQDRLSTNNVLRGNSMNKRDTMLFINQFSDTIQFDVWDRFSNQALYITSHPHSLCPDAIVMVASSSLSLPGPPIYVSETSFISVVGITLEKTVADEFVCNFGVILNNGKGFGTTFSLTDSIIFIAIYDPMIEESVDVYLKTYVENYLFDGKEFENCLIFEVKDLDHTERFKTIYSNKYGFLKIKNDNHEIKRLF